MEENLEFLLFCPRYAKETDVMTKLRHFVVYIHLGTSERICILSAEENKTKGAVYGNSDYGSPWSHTAMSTTALFWSYLWPLPTCSFLDDKVLSRANSVFCFSDSVSPNVGYISDSPGLWTQMH